MVWASNFSTGVNTLFWLTRKAAEILGPAYDLEIVEMHHRLKRDAPSGTAKTLAEILADARKLQLDKAARHGRAGITGERTPGEIGIHSVRGGDVVGDHTVIFANDRRAARTDAQGFQPRHVCQRRVARRALGRQTETRPLHHAGRAGTEMNSEFEFGVRNEKRKVTEPPHVDSHLAFVALGSNLGDSRQIILDAMARLQNFSDQPILKSSLWQTSPVNCPPGSPVL